MKSQQLYWSRNSGWTAPTGPSLSEAAQLVFVFGSPDSVVASGCFEKAKRLYPKANVVGCTAAGEIHGSVVSYDSVSMTAVWFEHTCVKVVQAEVNSPDRSRQAGETLAQALPTTELSSVFVLSAGFSVHGGQLVRGISSGLPPEVKVTGGFASNEDRSARTMVWCDGEPRDGMAIAIGFYGSRLRVNCGVSGGWGSFGPDRLVTKARGNVLYELDGQPALSLYKLYLGELASKLPGSALMFPLMVREHTSNREVLRALLSVDEQDQSVTLGGEVEEGSYARLMRGSIERLLENIAEMAHANFSNQLADLALVVSCFGRQSVLKQRTEEELDALHEVLSSETPMTGFYSNGEIAPPNSGGSPELHNETLVITTFAEV